MVRNSRAAGPSPPKDDITNGTNLLILPLPLVRSTTVGFLRLFSSSASRRRSALPSPEKRSVLVCESTFTIATSTKYSTPECWSKNARSAFHSGSRPISRPWGSTPFPDTPPSTAGSDAVTPHWCSACASANLTASWVSIDRPKSGQLPICRTLSAWKVCSPLRPQKCLCGVSTWGTPK